MFSKTLKNIEKKIGKLPNFEGMRNLGKVIGGVLTQVQKWTEWCSRVKLPDYSQFRTRC